MCVRAVRCRHTRTYQFLPPQWGKRIKWCLYVCMYVCLSAWWCFIIIIMHLAVVLFGLWLHDLCPNTLWLRRRLSTTNCCLPFELLVLLPLPLPSPGAVAPNEALLVSLRISKLFASENEIKIKEKYGNQ